MKKILLALALLFCTLPTLAFEVEYYKSGKLEKHVPEIGFRLLNSNQIPYRMIFTVLDNNKTVNAWTSYSSREIKVTKALLTYMQNDDELAAILAHEISHGVDSNKGIFRGTFSYLSNKFNSKKYEYKADKRSIDYLVKAGYNPLGFIVAMNKIGGQGRYDWNKTHPLTSRRLAEVYEYIYKKYPQYLVQNEYKDNIYYQNFLLTSRENRKKLEQKVKNNSKGRVNYL